MRHARITLPTGVIRLSFSPVESLAIPSFSASTRMLRNLRIANSFPSVVNRVCLYKTGPLSVILIAIAVTKNTGLSITIAIAENTISTKRFMNRYSGWGSYRLTRSIGKWNMCIWYAPDMIVSPIRGITKTVILFSTQCFRITLRSWLWIPLMNTVLTPSSIDKSLIHSCAVAVSTTLYFFPNPYWPIGFSMPFIVS